MSHLRIDAEFMRTVLAQALGTLLAALVILLVGIAAGVVSNVDLRSWISIAAAALAVTSSAWVLALIQDARKNMARDKAMAAYRGMTPEEKQALGKYLDKGCGTT